MLEYEYEPEMEESYRADFLKSFRKTVEKGYFSFIIIDAVNDKVSHDLAISVVISLTICPQCDDQQSV